MSAILKAVGQRDRERLHQIVYEMVATVDWQLSRGLHLRDRDGKILTQLDQVMVAIEAGRWPCKGVKG